MSKNQPSHKLHISFFHGDKGGVGKSFACKTYIDFLLSRGIDVTPIDCDTRNPDIDRLFSPYTDVYKVNLHEEGGWAALFEHIQHSSGNIAISLPAGIGDKTDRYGDVFMESVSLINAKVTTWWVLGNTFDSVNLLQDAINKGSLLARDAIAIRNEFFGTDFFQWEDSPTRTQFLKMGGQEMSMSVLPQRLADRIDRAGLPFSQACNTKEGELTIFDQVSLRNWVSTVHTAFDGLRVPLLTTPIRSREEA